MINGTVDREFEDHGDNGLVSVMLDNGFEVNLWLTGLAYEEYINRTNIIYNLEANGN